MKICICNVREKQAQLEVLEKQADGKFIDIDQVGWKRGGNDIKYELSKLNKIIERQPIVEAILQGELPPNTFGNYYRGPYFFQMSFTHDFNIKGLDEVYFAYMYPYTFTRLTRFLKDLKSDQEVMKCLKDCLLCPSLSGVDVPYLIVTSRANEIDY